MKPSISKFEAPDQSEVLTIGMSSGKKGFNVRVSVKQRKAKGKKAPKAKVGCRESFATVGEATAAYTKLQKEAASRGWTELEVVSRNAFSVIPEAPKSSKAVTKSNQKGGGPNA